MNHTHNAHHAVVLHGLKRRSDSSSMAPESERHQQVTLLVPHPQQTGRGAEGQRQEPPSVSRHRDRRRHRSEEPVDQGEKSRANHARAVRERSAEDGRELSCSLHRREGERDQPTFSGGGPRILACRFRECRAKRTHRSCCTLAGSVAMVATAISPVQAVRWGTSACCWLQDQKVRVRPC